MGFPRQLERDEDLLSLFDVAPQVSLAVDDEGRRVDLAEMFERALFPEGVGLVPLSPSQYSPGTSGKSLEPTMLTRFYTQRSVMAAANSSV